MTPSEAGGVLGLSADMVRVLADQGRLPTLRTVSGRRLFRQADVEQLRRERAHARPTTPSSAERSRR
jgi:excisionase family DNA binding protein